MILSNPWVVGIGGGILSGLFVAIITRLIFSRRDKREYIQRIQLANSEVLYAVRPGVSEGLIPNKGVVKSLISATARKYNVDKEDMLNSNDLADELIKEVMDSSFISASAKDDFCEKLTGFRDGKGKTVERREPIGEYEIMSQYRRQTVAILSMMVGTMTGIMSILVSFELGNTSIDERILFLALPAGISVLVAFALRILKDLKAQAMKVRFMGTEISFREREEKVAEPKDGLNSR